MQIHWVLWNLVEIREWKTTKEYKILNINFVYIYRKAIWVKEDFLEDRKSSQSVPYLYSHHYKAIEMFNLKSEKWCTL